jgi:peptidoglycan lytic transglycosylase G
VTDGLGLFDDSRGDLDDERPRTTKRRPRRRRRPIVWVAIVVVVGLIGAGVWFGLTQILGIGGFDDYAGAGEKDVVIEVTPGQRTGDIANTLKEKDVVASARAFTSAGDDQPKVRSIQPGYYVLKTKMSGKAAVDKLTTSGSRVGQLQIKAGTQFDDIQLPDGKTIQGVLSLIAKAGCVPLNGNKDCVTAEQLRKVAETADLAALGAPAWAIPDAKKAEPKRRLEGLILPGVYDIQPGLSAEALMRKMVSNSAAGLDGMGMPRIAQDTGYTPYQVLVMASLIEREAITKDFGKVSRVTYNRLAKSIKLGYDSTINYVLDKPAIRTTRADREKPGPYNSYLNTGLPPTPIAAVSAEALKAATKPEDGTYVFFVKCQKDGTSCFADTQAQHDQNIREAQARGAY